MNLYHFTDPVAIRVTTHNKSVIRDYFDTKKNSFVIDNPQKRPVHSDNSVDVWMVVDRIHENGTPRKMEFKDKDDKTVAQEFFNEEGSLVMGWRLREGMNEVWNMEKREWLPQP